MCCGLLRLTTAIMMAALRRCDVHKFYITRQRLSSDTGLEIATTRGKTYSPCACLLLPLTTPAGLHSPCTSQEHHDAHGSISAG